MKMKCSKCKERYEIRPYEIRNDELCPKCASKLTDLKSAKISETLSENEMSISSEEFFIPDVEHLLENSGEIAIGELQCEKDRIRFLPLVTYKQYSVPGFVIILLLIGSFFFGYYMGLCGTFLIVFILMTLANLMVWATNSYAKHGALSKYKLLSAKNELRVKSKQMIEIPKSAIQKTKKNGNNLQVFQKNQNGDPIEFTFMLKESSWNICEHYMLNLSEVTGANSSKVEHANATEHSIPFKNTDLNLPTGDNVKGSKSKSTDIAETKEIQSAEEKTSTKSISKIKVVFLFPFTCIMLAFWIFGFCLSISGPFLWGGIYIIFALPVAALSVLVIIGIVKQYCYLFSKDPETKYKGADGICTFGMVGLILSVVFFVGAVVVELVAPSHPKNNKMSNTVKHVEFAKKNNNNKSYAKVSYFEYEGISFEYPSTLSAPDKTIFDIDKVRKMLSPSGVEILSVVMSPDMNTTIQVARTKRDISIDALYEEKSSLADEINKGGINVMGEQYRKFTADKAQLTENIQALSLYGEKANGEVAVTLEFLNEGYVYGIMFIYGNKSHMQVGSKIREEVVKSINITVLTNASEKENPSVESNRALETKQPQAKQKHLSIENQHYNTKAISRESVELINQMNKRIDPNSLIQELETIKKVAQKENATHSVTEINNLIENLYLAIKLNEVGRERLRSEIYRYLQNRTKPLVFQFEIPSSEPMQGGRMNLKSVHIDSKVEKEGHNDEWMEGWEYIDVLIEDLYSVISNFQEALQRTNVELDNSRKQNIKVQNEINRITADLYEKTLRIQYLEEQLVSSDGTAKTKDKATITDLDIEGRITLINESMIQISIGAGDGVKDNMVFHVTRDDIFLCDVVIIRVEPNLSIGVLQLVQQRPQIGDKVSLRL